VFWEANIPTAPRKARKRIAWMIRMTLLSTASILDSFHRSRTSVRLHALPANWATAIA
jgi:hypothetical protein